MGLVVACQLAVPVFAQTGTTQSSSETTQTQQTESTSDTTQTEGTTGGTTSTTETDANKQLKILPLHFLLSTPILTSS